MSKHDDQYFIEITSVFNLTAMREIAEGLVLHARYVDEPAAKVMKETARSINNFIALHNSRKIMAAETC